jgi:uncharacterized protein YggE
MLVRPSDRCHFFLKGFFMRISSSPLVALVLLMAMPALAAEPVPPRTISTSGEATVYVVPDKVIVNFGVESHAADLDSARKENETEGAKLVKAIEAMGLEKKDIATDHLQVDVRRRTSNDVEVIRGYTVRRGYSVTLRDIKQFEKLVDAGLKNGANQIHGITFATTDLRKHRDQARQMAIKAAKEKAVLLAKELDCTVGKPRTISEGGGHSYFGGYRWGNASMSQNTFQHAPGGAESGESLPLGQIAITATVSVTFDLE